MRTEYAATRRRGPPPAARPRPRARTGDLQESSYSEASNYEYEKMCWFDYFKKIRTVPCITPRHSGHLAPASAPAPPARAVSLSAQTPHKQRCPHGRTARTASRSWHTTHSAALDAPAAGAAEVLPEEEDAPPPPPSCCALNPAIFRRMHVRCSAEETPSSVRSATSPRARSELPSRRSRAHAAR